MDNDDDAYNEKALASYRYVVRRAGRDVPIQPSLRGKLQPNDENVRVIFVIAPGCKDVELSLTSYQMQRSHYDPNWEQIRIDFATGHFDAGQHEMVVDLPAPCWSQVDLAFAGSLARIGPNPPSYYGDRLIDAAHGGSRACAPVTVIE